MNDKNLKKRILIIAEGNEEKPYIEKILSFPNINKEVYLFSNVVNAKGATNIFARYQYEIQRGFNDLILVFCDVDKGTEHFYDIMDKIGMEFFIDKRDAIKVFIFVNPVTLQLVLLHFGNIHLSKVSKKENSKYVEELIGIKNYDAKESQIKEIVNKIHSNSMELFKERVNKISTDIKAIPSTNFLIFLQRFESDDTSWIDEIQQLLK